MEQRKLAGLFDEGGGIDDYCELGAALPVGTINRRRGGPEGTPFTPVAWGTIGAAPSCATLVGGRFMAGRVTEGGAKPGRPGETGIVCALAGGLPDVGPLPGWEGVGGSGIFDGAPGGCRVCCCVAGAFVISAAAICLT